MARTLTGDATTEKNKTDDVFPYTLIKIEWGGSVGTKWYADYDLGNADASSWDNADGRVDSWGSILAQTSLNPKPAVGDVSIRLRDEDLVLHGYLGDVDIENKIITVYQQFVGNAESDLITLFKGTAVGPVMFIENGRVLTFTVLDMGSHYDREFANYVNKDDFPKVLDDDEGKMVPIVYGRVKKAPSVFAVAGGRGRLLNLIRGTDTSEPFYVEGGEDFTQSDPITIRVGQEHIEGSFDGAEFTPTARGAVIANGTILGTGDNARILWTNLTGQDGQYVGYFLKVLVHQHGGGDGFQNRRIIRSTAGGVIEIILPLYYTGHVDSYDAVAVDMFFGVGQEYRPPAQTPCWIITQARPHNEGELVVEVLPEYVYIANDYPSTRVDGVFGWGRKKARTLDVDDIDGLSAGGGFMNFGTATRFNIPELTDDTGLTPPAGFEGPVETDRDSWVAIEPSMYTVNRNDSQFSAELGHNCTTITFHGLPPALMGIYDFSREDLHVDIQGIDTNGNGTGTLEENPARLIEDFLETIGGMPANLTDDASITDAADRMGGLTFGFSLTNPQTLMQVVQDLAFQCRCSLNWDDGVAFLRWLVNGPGTSVATITDNKRLLDSIVKSRLDFESEIKSAVRAAWKDEDTEREVVVSDATAQAAFGRKELQINCWALRKKDDVKAIANFWLRRLKEVWPIYRWKDYLDTIELQRNDTVKLDVSSYAASESELTLTKVTHKPGRGVDSSMDEIEFEAIGWWGWNETICQAYCETGGCETAMEIAECTGACETSCQGRCQLGGCEVGGDIVCTTSLAAAPCEFAEVADLFECESTGDETGLFTECTYACMTCGCQSCGCQTHGCETSCQSAGCETVGCETCGCQTCGCETDCQTGCEVSCETGCETSCETECQLAGCETTCESGCETHGCETDCQTGGCETEGCQLDTQ